MVPCIVVVESWWCLDCVIASVISTEICDLGIGHSVVILIIIVIFIVVCYYLLLLLYNMSRVSDQSGVSLLHIMLEIHHSGREPSIYMSVLLLIVADGDGDD